MFITNYRIIVNIPILRINHNSRIRSRLVLNSFLSTKFIYLHIFFLIGFLAQNLTVHSKKIILFINFVFVKLSRHDDGRYWIFLTKFIKFHSVCRTNVFFFRLKFWILICIWIFDLIFFCSSTRQLQFYFIGDRLDNFTSSRV